MQRLIEIFDPKGPSKGWLILGVSFVLFGAVILIGQRILPDSILRIVSPALLAVLILSVLAVALSYSRIVATKLNLPPLVRFPMAFTAILAAWLIPF